MMRATMRVRHLSSRQLATPDPVSQMRGAARPIARRVTGRRNRMLARALWERDQGKCQRCGLWIDPSLSGALPGGLTIGHVVPLSRGGSNDPSNLGPEHSRCNIAAGAREPRPAAVIVTPL